MTGKHLQRWFLCITFTATLAITGSSLCRANADCPPGDLSGDCQVDMVDLLQFVDLWLAPDSGCEESGLAARWRMDETGGEWTSDDIGGHTAYLVGDARLEPAWGYLDGAVVLDGDGDYLEATGYQGIGGVNPRTCAAWIFTRDDEGDLIWWGDNSVDGGKWNLRFVTNGGTRVPALAVRGGRADGTLPIYDDTWVHVAAVLPAGKTRLSDVRLYVNGIPQNPTALQVSEDVTINTRLAGDVRIGSLGLEGAGNVFMAGRIDDVRLYDRALSDEEVWRLYSTGSTVAQCPDLDGRPGINHSDLARISEHWQESVGPVVISEFMADNETDDLDDPGQRILDGDGRASDWIELHNVSDQAVDLTGWSLVNGDVPDDLTTWPFPDGLTLTAGGYLLLFATDKPLDPQNPQYYHDGTYYHTNFKLSSDAEYLALLDDLGRVVHAFTEFEYDDDRFGYPDQEENISYGYFFGQHQYFVRYTPGAANEAGFLDFVDEPRFSVQRGFYDLSENDPPLSIELTCPTADAQIYFTLDGSDPTPAQDHLYTGPIELRKTTCVRAAAYRGGYHPSESVTHTYLVNVSDAIKGMPVISLVGDASETFYQPNGVMAIVGGTWNSGVWQAVNAGDYNNVLGHGMDYERPVSFEYLEPDGTARLQENCGLRVHGSDWMRPRYTRPAVYGVWSYPSKFSFRLYFRDQYGKNRLEYPLFPSEVDRFKSIVIRGGHNDISNPFVRDELQRRLHKDMGNAASVGIFVNLFINGDYKGYFNPCEHIKEESCQEWFDSDKPWDIVRQGDSVADGDRISYDRMRSFISGNSLISSANYLEAGRLVNIPNFIDYIMVQTYGGNWDWPQNNWSVGAEHSDQGQWNFFVWDIEGGMHNNATGDSRFNELNSQGNTNGIVYRALKANPDFRQTFCDRAQKHFLDPGGALSKEHIEERFWELAALVEPVIPYIDRYIPNTWIPQREGYYFPWLVQEGLWTFAAPRVFLNAVETWGGRAMPGDEVVLQRAPDTSGNIYYTLDGTDPRVSSDQSGPGGVVSLIDDDDTRYVHVPTESLLAPQGSVIAQYFNDISTGTIAALMSHPGWPDQPDQTQVLTRFEIPVDRREHYGTRIPAYLHPTVTGDYTFWIASDDNGELWLSPDVSAANAQRIAYVPSWTSSRQWNWYAEQQSDFIRLEAGSTYYIEALMGEGTGGDNLAVAWQRGGTNNPQVINGSYLSSAGIGWVLPDFNHSGWQSGTGPVGYETRPGDSVNYADIIDIDVEAEMDDQNASCLIRIPFTYDGSDVTSLSLSMRYDDGFIAYLNGTEVRRVNFNAETVPDWNSGASATHSDSAAVVPQTFDISNSIGLLRPGNNMLAIHGLNYGTGSSDFLIGVELNAFRVNVGEISPTAQQYSGPLTLDNSVHIKARTLNGSTWSALREVILSAQPTVGDLRIAELMYHPQGDPNLEYIELINQGAEPLDVTGVRFTDGIAFAFDGRATWPEALLHASFDDDAEDFTFQADAFGTSNPDAAEGFYEAQAGHSGGAVQIYLEKADDSQATSGAWRRSFTLAQAAQVTVRLRWRLEMGEGYETDEYAEAILAIDGARYGPAAGPSLSRRSGDGNGGGDMDSGWQEYSTTVALSAGAHTLSLGAYNNHASNVAYDWTQVSFDEVVVAVSVPTDPVIPAGQRVVLARDALKFQARYGVAVPLIGQFSGRLDDAGERLTLVDIRGEVIQSFRYDDDWFELTDGEGFSLSPRKAALAEPWHSTEGLVGRWAMDQTAGTTVPDSLGLRDGQLLGAEGDEWGYGRFGRALDCDGQDDQVTVTGYQGIAGTTSRTVTAWLHTTDRGVLGHLFGWGPPGVTGAIFQVRLWELDDGKISLRLGYGNGAVTGTREVADGQWHHVAIVLDSDSTPEVSVVSFYVDGRLDARHVLPLGTIDTQLDAEMQIGGYIFPFLGLIDEFCLYDRALSDEELRAMGDLDDFWSDKKRWRPSAERGGSPGTDEPAWLPELGTVVANELLSHSHAAIPDWIELHNTTDQPVDIGGWYLSDRSGADPNRMKYEIPAGTVLGPDGYVVFGEATEFGNPEAPGCHQAFGLSEGGETLYLHSGREGQITGYVEEETFDAAESGVAFGRYQKSTGAYNFVAMAQNTPGTANIYGPKVGPFVISEIHYDPSAAPDDEAGEFIEIKNVSPYPQALQNEVTDATGPEPWQIETKTVPWRMTDGIEYAFDPGLVIPAGGYVLLVKDEATFRALYPDVPSEPQVYVFEWTSGNLNNGGEKVELSMAGDKEWGEDRYWIRADRVNYDDDRPWPMTAAGTGKSLTHKNPRLDPAAYGNDPINWTAADPSPGR